MQARWGWLHPSALGGSPTLPLAPTWAGRWVSAFHWTSAQRVPASAGEVPAVRPGPLTLPPPPLPTPADGPALWCLQREAFWRGAGDTRLWVVEAHPDLQAAEVGRSRTGRPGSRL